MSGFVAFVGVALIGASADSRPAWMAIAPADAAHVGGWHTRDREEQWFTVASPMVTSYAMLKRRVPVLGWRLCPKPNPSGFHDAIRITAPLDPHRPGYANRSFYMVGHGWYGSVALYDHANTTYVDARIGIDHYGLC